MASSGPAAGAPEQYACPVYLTCGGRTYRLPGPLALLQTGGTDAKQVTHINTWSLQEIADACPELPTNEAAAATAAVAPLLTSVSRDGVTVQALMVVAVHAGLLAPVAAAAGGQLEAAAAEAEQRRLQRAAARLTYGLAGIIFELMHCQAGHWLGLGPLERQVAAGTTLTQLYRLDRGLAMAVLRAYGQLTPERFAEMLEHGLLPSPGKAAAAPAPPASAAADGGCTTQQVEEGPPEAAAQV